MNEVKNHIRSLIGFLSPDVADAEYNEETKQRIFEISHLQILLDQIEAGHLILVRRWTTPSPNTAIGETVNVELQYKTTGTKVPLSWVEIYREKTMNRTIVEMQGVIDEGFKQLKELHDRCVKADIAVEELTNGKSNLPKDTTQILTTLVVKSTKDLRGEIAILTDYFETLCDNLTQFNSCILTEESSPEDITDKRS